MFSAQRTEERTVKSDSCRYLQYISLTKDMYQGILKKKRKHWINKEKAKSQVFFKQRFKKGTSELMISKCSLKSTSCLLIICCVKDFLSKERNTIDSFCYLTQSSLNRVPIFVQQTVDFTPLGSTFIYVQLIKNRGIEFLKNFNFKTNSWCPGQFCSVFTVDHWPMVWFLVQGRIPGLLAQS